MPRLVSDGRFAVLKSVPAGSKLQSLTGTSGVLEIWESEHAYPGKFGALFYYPYVLPDAHHTVALHYLKTTFSYDVSTFLNTVTFTRGNRSYVFEVNEAIVSYDELGESERTRTFGQRV